MDLDIKFEEKIFRFIFYVSEPGRGRGNDVYTTQLEWKTNPLTRFVFQTDLGNSFRVSGLHKADYNEPLNMITKLTTFLFTESNRFI